MKTYVSLVAALALATTPALAQQNFGGGGTGSGTVQQITTSCGVAGGTITTTGNIQNSLTPTTKTANYTTALTDCGSALFFNIASAATLTLANLTTTSNFVNVRNLATSGGVLTISPSSGTIDGLASLTLQPGAPGITIAFDGTNYTTSGVASAGKVLLNAQTGTSYTVAATDYAKLVTFTNASAIAVSLPSASFTNGDFLTVRNIAGAAGAVTITPTSGTIDGGATLVLAPGTPAVSLAFDGTNWTTTGKAVVGPSSSVVNDCAKWGGVNGQILVDGACGGGGTYSTLVSATGAGTYTLHSNTTTVVVFGCGGGGSGGGGAIYGATATAAGSGGGAGDCHQKTWRVSDLGGAATVINYTVGAGGASVAGKTNTVAANGNAGNAGSNTTFSAATGTETWYAGGGGGAGLGSASTNLNGGAAGGLFGAGANASTASTCQVGATGNGGGSGGGASSNMVVCSTGGGGALNNANGAVAGNSYGGAPGGGGAGGGAAAQNVAYNGGNGGTSLGCATNQTGGAGSTSTNGTNGGSAAAIPANAPGCGGGGGGNVANTTGPFTAGNGGAGTNGGGGGGGGNASTATSANTSGAGGKGGDGFLFIEEF